MLKKRGSQAMVQIDCTMNTRPFQLKEGPYAANGHKENHLF
jgi:hypothetical protein